MFFFLICLYSPFFSLFSEKYLEYVFYRKIKKRPQPQGKNGWNTTKSEIKIFSEKKIEFCMRDEEKKPKKNLHYTKIKGTNESMQR